jgi:pimeloyl-ACP methyl ester carboxylesterase/quercetin dioxygenase-like cupin family protein
MRKLLFLAPMLANLAFAQDPLVVDPSHYKVEYEDENVRVLRVTLAPGEISPLHDHPERISVVVRSARLRLIADDGTAQELELPTGATNALAAVRHSVTNIGTTTFEEIATEFKQPGTLTKLASGTSSTKTAVVTTHGQPPAADSPKPVIGSERQPTAAPALAQPPAMPPLAKSASEAPVNLESDIAPVVVQPIRGTRVVKVGDYELAYVERGQGEPLILVHDALADLRSWSSQFNPFSDGYRVIAYSRRCHYPNICTGKEQNYTYEQHADDLAALVKSLNLGKAHIVGHAYGGAVAMVFAMKYPELTRSLVLMEPPLDDLLPGRFGEAARYSRREILGIARKAILKRRDIDSAVRTYVEWSRGTGSWDETPAAEKEQRRQNGNSLAAYGEHPDPPLFKCEDGTKIKVPVLVARGELSKPNDITITERLIGCIAGADRLSVRNATHNMHRENPEAFNQAVLEFLAEHAQ